MVWRSHDGEPHTVVAPGGAFASPLLARHGEFAHRFDTTGSFPYVCSLHPFMRGSVEVRRRDAPAAPPAATKLELGARGSHLVARVSPPRPGAVLALERHFRDRFAWRQVAHRRLGAAAGCGSGCAGIAAAAPGSCSTWTAPLWRRAPCCVPGTTNEEE